MFVSSFETLLKATKKKEYKGLSYIINKMSLSEDDTVSTKEESDCDSIENDQLFQILGQFLVTEDGRNITICVDELVKELREMKTVFMKMTSLLKHFVPKPQV